MPVTAEDGQISAAMLRATQPAGAVFALGWVMAELFDPQRRAGVPVRTLPFDPAVQLPLVADLAPDPKLVFLAAELSELLRWFPHLHWPLRLVTRQTDKVKAAVAAENLATAEAAEQSDDAETEPSPRTLRGEAAAAAREAAFSETEFLAAVTSLHQAILDGFADDPERLNAYQLGLALSDLVWVPRIAAPGGESPASQPGALFAMFARSHLTAVQTLLSGAGAQLPSGAATIVSRSLDHWADWIDVNSRRIKSPAADAWGPGAAVVLNALRAQGWVWRSVLIADPEVAVQPSTRAWAQAGSSIARTTGVISGEVLRRFWPLVALALVTLGGLLYLVISNLSGLSEVWASLATVAAIVGPGTWSLGNWVSSSINRIGYDIWNAARVDATAWGITWLPAVKTTMAGRARLEQRGVGAPQIRKSLDVNI